MRTWLVFCILLSVTACGGGRGGEAGAGASGCTVLGFNGPMALTVGDTLQVSIEVRFLQVADNFFERVGVDFDFVVPADPQPTPEFGGAFQNRPGYLVPDGVVARTSGTQILVPNNHRPGSYLPLAYPGAAPGIGQALSFVQAPGLDDECLDVYLGARFPLDDDAGLAATTAIVPTGALPAGEGIALAFLDDTQVQILLQAVRDDASSEIIEAPKLDLFDRQRAISLALTTETVPTDLLDVVLSEVYGGTPLGTVQSGVTLDVRPVISTDRTTIELQIRPTSHGALATNGTPLAIGGAALSVQMPILVPVTVQSLVSVPDGGTVLLGGLKRLSDDRQPGIPLLSKIPYVNRLFKNTSTSRSTDALMIMVTPRIIVQAEEE